MKKLALMALLLTPLFASAQKDLDPKVAPPFINYLEISISDMGFGRNAYNATYRYGIAGEWEPVVNEEGKAHKFASLAVLLDYFDKQGFVYLMPGFQNSDVQRSLVLKKKS